MALISCPECGHPISDKAPKCPSCEHCMQPSVASVSPAVSPSAPPLPSAATDTAREPHRNPLMRVRQFAAPFFNKRILLCSLLALITLAAVFILSRFLFHNITVKNISIEKWTLTDSTSYSNYYEGRITSDQSKPFVAVIGNYTSEKSVPSFVYVENGAGIFRTSVSDNEDPSLIYRPIGYLSGETVSDSSISISYSDHDYFDWSYSNSTDCTVDIDIKLKNNQSGILIFDVINESNNETSRNHSAVVVNGSTTYSYSAELPYKSRGVEIKVVPRSFCKCKPVSGSDYTITSPYSVEYEKSRSGQSYSGQMTLQFDNISDGFILYTRTLTDGGMTHYRNISRNLKIFLNNGECTFSTYDYADSNQTLLTPTYEYNIIGHIYWTSL